MRVTFPLWLKVSLCLLLNLLLLGALAVGFFVVQGGLGWSALLSGATGERAQARANSIVTEVAAAPAETRPAMLARFGAANAAHFFLRRMDEPMTATAATPEIPASVSARMALSRPPGRGPGSFGKDGGPGGRGGARGGFGLGDGIRREKDGGHERDGVRREPPPEGRPRSGPEPRFAPPDLRENGRFIERAGSPARFWVVQRVAYPVSEYGGRPVPAFLLARVDSFWGLLQFLGLESWILAGAAVLGLSVLFWLPLVGGITRSIRQLTRATEQIAEGRFDGRVSTRRRDELGRLGDSVNRMAARLDAHMTGQKRFLGDVAHELCSPLARLQMATGILDERATPALQPTIADVREEVQQLSTLVNELLAFTKAGLTARDIVLVPVELAPLALEVLAREDPGHRVTLAIAPGLRVRAEPGLLARALGNLVRNALRYSGDTGAITLAARPEEVGVVIAVEDDGPGVPAAALDRLGEPFFRPEEARTRESGGVGLGLAIVRTSVAACGGEVRFANRTPRGFRAELLLAAA